MSDDLPRIPSDEELGITEEDIRAWEEEAAGDPKKPEAPPAGKPPEPPPPPAKRPLAPPTGGSPPRAWRGPVTLLFLLVLGWASSTGRALPDAVGVAAPDTAFASGRAMLDVVDIARAPHPPGSPEHARVREMLQDRLAGLGLTPEVQTATSLRRVGDRVAGATVRNVLARMPGTESTGAVLLTAHYDGRQIARGAGDDATGVATILETVRALAAGPRLRNDVIVLLTDGEELGLLGARSFIEEHPWVEDIAVVLSVEMRGGGGPSIMFETGSENGWIVEAFGDASPRPFANSLSVDIYRSMPNDTDFSPFRDRGFQGLNFAGIDNAHVYHQQWDEPSRLDERTLQHHGMQVLAVTRELGGRDLSNVDAPDRAYLDLPFLGLVAFPPALGYVLAVVLMVAFGGAFVLVRRKGGTVAGVLVGLVLAVVVGLLTAGAGHLLFLQMRGVHPEYGSLQGSAFHVEGWYVSAIVAVAAAATLLLLALARRRFPLGALALGAVVPALLGAAVVPFVLPLGSHNLQWPVLLALVAVVLVAGVAPGRRPGILAWIGLLLIVAGIATLAVPLTEFVWLALSLRAAAVIGVLVAVWAALSLPLLDTLREPGGGWAAVLCVVAAAAFVGVGALHARPSPERPAPSTLVYVLDRDSVGAVWATREGSGAGWAAARTGAPLDATRYLDALLLASGPWRSASAPAAGIPLPEARILGGAGGPVRMPEPARPEPAGPEAPGDTPENDTTGGTTGAAGDTAPGTPARGDTAADSAGADTTAGAAVEGPGTADDALPDASPDRPRPTAAARRTISLALRSAAGAERMIVRVPESADVHLVSVNGVPVPEPDPRDRDGAQRVRTVSHWGTPEGEDGLVLELDVGPSVADVELEVIEHHLRPGELVGERWFVRPPSLAPDITTGSDRVVVRTRVRIEGPTGGG